MTIVQRMKGTFSHVFISLRKSCRSPFLVAVLVLSLLSCSEQAGAELLTLGEGLRLAAENNRLIKMAQGEEAVSEADSLLVKSAMLPSISASLRQTFLAYQPGVFIGQQPVAVPTSEKSFLSYSMGIEQTLYDFRRTASRYEATRHLIGTKRLDTRRVRNQVSLDVALGYFDLLESEKIVSVQEKEVQRLRSHLHDARSLYEEGSITRNDLLQAEVRLSDALQRLLSARNARALNASRLNNILARPLLSGLQVADLDDAAQPSVLMNLEGAWEQASRQRPELLITDEIMKTLDQEEISRNAEFYPRIYAGGAFDYTENRYQVNEVNWSLVLGMSVSLFSGGSTKAELLKISRQKLLLLEQKRKISDDVRLEVERSYLDLRNAESKLSVTRDAVGQADENLRINTVRYSEGTGTATEVLDAVTLLTVAETNHYRSLYDFRRAEAGLLYSVGRDLSEVYE